MSEHLTDTNVGNIEYICRKDAVNACQEGWNNSVQDCINNIKVLKPADVVQVVRCKDCKHYYFADNRIPQEQRYVCEISGEVWKPDSFCSFGERKE